MISWKSIFLALLLVLAVYTHSFAEDSDSNDGGNEDPPTDFA